MASQRIVVDDLTPLSHIEAIGTGDQASASVLKVAPSWVPIGERRRLNAYMYRAALIGNGSRQFLPSKVTEEERADHREYGDPAVLVQRIAAALLGDGWTIGVDGAADDLTTGPDLPDTPAPLGDEPSDTERRIHAALTASHASTAEEALIAWEQALEAQPAVRQRQADLDAWADRTQLRSHIDEAERDTIGLADSVTVLWPGGEGEWPYVEVYDPGVYFPELDDSGDDDGQFPGKVHLAWEFDSTNDLGVTERFVRRITFELVDLTGEAITVDRRGDVAWVGPDGQPADAPTLAVTDRVVNGRIVRTLPWPGPDGQPATTETTCILSDGVWRLPDVQSNGGTMNDVNVAEWRRQRVDLGIDHIPVIHGPGSQSKGHWGTSVLDKVAQLLGDVARIDGDVMGGSEYLGAPVVAMAGKREFADGVPVIPGRAYNTGEGGRMDTLDLSAGIDKLTKLRAELRDLLYGNVGVPAEVMGRFDGGQIAGITLLLKWAPFAQLIAALRQIRDPKHRLFLRFAQRQAMVSGAIEAGPIPTARIVYGNFLPTDREATLTLVAAAVTAHVMSTQTAVSMLIAAGVPVDDAQEELERIRHENYSAARDLADSVGSELEAAKYLGIDPPAAAAPPDIVLPPIA